MDAATFREEFCELATQATPLSTTSPHVPHCPQCLDCLYCPHCDRDISPTTFKGVSGWLSNVSPGTPEDTPSEIKDSEDCLSHDGLSEFEDSASSFPESEDTEDGNPADGNSEDGESEDGEPENADSEISDSEESDTDDEGSEDIASKFRNTPVIQQTTSSDHQNQHSVNIVRLRIAKVQLKISSHRERIRHFNRDLARYRRSGHRWWDRPQETQLYEVTYPRARSKAEALLLDYQRKIKALEKERSRLQMILYSESGTFERPLNPSRGSTGEDEAKPAQRRIAPTPCCGETHTSK
ncbi:hypothetical protein F5Y03DRAFT_390961 [Xylaria venustula]|nr:hypothetical protein F5Y03DRAFT_390961 [Xylaria venustula]